MASDNEQDPKDEAGRREREREVHRAQLDAVRDAFSARGEGLPPQPPEPAPDPGESERTEYLVFRLRNDVRKLERRQRNTARMAVGLAIAVAIGAVALVQQALGGFGSAEPTGEIRALSIRADRISVTRDLRVVDPQGNELAVFGRDHDSVVLGLNASGDPSRQLVRLAASTAGAGVTLGEPTGASSLSMLTTRSGSTVEVRNGEQTERLSGAQPELPAVSAGPKAHATMLGSVAEAPLFTPRKDGPPSGDLPEVREVGNGFLVADLSAISVPDGVEVRGRMVNTTAVVHSGLAFRITLGDTSSVVMVPKISPGNSTGFRATLPGVADPGAGVRFEYLGSTVAFQATSTEPVYGRRVEPK